MKVEREIDMGCVGHVALLLTSLLVLSVERRARLFEAIKNRDASCGGASRPCLTLSRRLRDSQPQPLSCHRD